MADSDLFIDSFTDPRTRLQLETGHRLAKALASTADKVQSLCRWAAAKDAYFVPLFDFDVICSVLPSVVTRDLLQSTRQETWIRNLGPNALAATVFNHRDAIFSLPYGAFAELLRRQFVLRGDLEERSSEWLRLERAVRHGEGIDLTRIPPADAARTLVTTFLEIATAYDDARLLEIVERNHRPFPSLVLGSPDGVAQRAFREAHQHLTRKRPDLDVNNTLDALSVSSVVWMMNNPVQEFAARPVPLFVTETGVLLDLRREETSWYGAAFSDSPRLINRSSVLQLYSFFLHSNDGKHYLAAKDAQMFQTQARGLDASYAVLLDRLYGQRPPDPSWMRYEFDRLVNDQRQFDNQWGALVLTFTRSFEHDRVSYLNLLHNDRFRSSVAQQIGHQIDTGNWDGAIARLEGFSPPGLAFWNLVNKYAVRHEAAVEVRLQADFIITVEDNSGKLMFESTPQHKLDRYEPGDEGERRILVHRRRSTPACVFAVDCRLLDAHGNPANVSVLWAHHATRRHLADAIDSLAWFFDFGSAAPPLRLRLFGRTSTVDEEYTIDRAAEALADPNHSYVEVHQYDRVWFADLAPLVSIEMQVGIVLPECEIDLLRCDDAAAHVAATSIEPIEREVATELLQQALRAVPIISQATMVST